MSKKKKLAKDEVSKNYAILSDNEPVGCFVICENDIPNAAEYNPNLACVCVDKKHRGNNFGLFILEKSKAELKRLGYKNAYLKTDLKNFYEKVGWYLIDKVGDEKIYIKLICDKIWNGEEKAKAAASDLNLCK